MLFECVTAEGATRTADAMGVPLLTRISKLASYPTACGARLMGFREIDPFAGRGRPGGVVRIAAADHHAPRIPRHVEEGAVLARVIAIRVADELPLALARLEHVGHRLGRHVRHPPIGQEPDFGIETEVPRRARHRAQTIGIVGPEHLGSRDRLASLVVAREHQHAAVRQRHIGRVVAGFGHLRPLGPDLGEGIEVVGLRDAAFGADRRVEAAGEEDPAIGRNECPEQKTS
jgi:hypothetical protein